MYVCLSVCPLTFLKNEISELYENNFCDSLARRADRVAGCVPGGGRMHGRLMGLRGRSCRLRLPCVTFILSYTIKLHRNDWFYANNATKTLGCRATPDCLVQLIGNVP